MTQLYAPIKQVHPLQFILASSLGTAQFISAPIFHPAFGVWHTYPVGSLLIAHTLPIYQAFIPDQLPIHMETKDE